MQMLKIIFSIAVCLVVVGCQNTVQGLGKDMQNTGSQIQKSVQ